MTQSPQSGPHGTEPRSANAMDAARATNEHSGAGVPSGGGDDTPPAEGSGVGPTNHSMDVEKTGERSWPKIILVVLTALVALGILLFILGRIQTIGN